MHQNLVNDNKKKDIWLMLPDTNNAPDDTERRYFLSMSYNSNNSNVVDRGEQHDYGSVATSLSTIKHYIKLPEARRKQCCALRDGWLLTMGHDRETAIVNINSHVEMALPSFRTVPKYGILSTYFPLVIKRAILTHNPSETSDFKVIVIHSFGLIAWARPGDIAWTVIPRLGTERCVDCVEDIAIHKGMLLGITDVGVWSCDMDADPESGLVWRCLLRMDPEIPKLLFCLEEIYLVESSGDLLVLFRQGVSRGDDDDYGTNEIHIYLLDLEENEWRKVTSLGNRTIFIGYNSSISVDASDIRGCEPNCVYFTEDYGAYIFFPESLTEEDRLSDIDPEFWFQPGVGGGKDMGIYDLSEGSIKSHFSLQSYSLVCPPLWVFPSFP